MNIESNSLTKIKEKIVSEFSLSISSNYNPEEEIRNLFKKEGVYLSIDHKINSKDYTKTPHEFIAGNKYLARLYSLDLNNEWISGESALLWLKSKNALLVGLQGLILGYKYFPHGIVVNSPNEIELSPREYNRPQLPYVYTNVRGDWMHALENRSGIVNFKYKDFSSDCSKELILCVSET
jgi:hypothetical protein